MGVARKAQQPTFDCRYFTKVPHFPGDRENLELAKYIQKKWQDYGFTSATLKKYLIMLSRPKKPGVVALYNESGQEIYRSAPQETFLVRSENNSNVVPPFNAYSPAGSVKVSVHDALYQVVTLKYIKGWASRCCTKTLAGGLSSAAMENPRYY